MEFFSLSHKRRITLIHFVCSNIFYQVYGPKLLKCCNPRPAACFSGVKLGEVATLNQRSALHSQLSLWEGALKDHGSLQIPHVHQLTNYTKTRLGLQLKRRNCNLLSSKPISKQYFNFPQANSTNHNLGEPGKEKVELQVFFSYSLMFNPMRKLHWVRRSSCHLCCPPLPHPPFD